MKILVLAGGYDQIALIQELKARGHIVYLADYFLNPPAKLYADRHFQVSTLDEEAIYQLAKDEKVDLLTTACTDQALLTVANVSEKLRLPCYISSDTARNVTNKAYMKKKFYDYKIPTAKWKVLEEESDYEEILKNEDFIYPMIVKPCDCNSSKGVIKVQNYDEMLQAIEGAFKLSRSKKVIIEEFKYGEEISIDVWKDKEGAKVLSVSGTNKIEQNQDNFTIFQSKYPIQMSQIVFSKIKDIAENISKAFELENCPILIQAIIHNDDISVIEFSARMGGGSKYKLIEYISGIDIMKVYVNRVLGDVTQIVNPVWSAKKIELNYVYTYNGVLDKICGFDELLKKYIIKELFLYKVKGDIIEKRTTSSDRTLGFLIEETTIRELEQQRKKILKNVKILDENGKDIMYKKCF